MTNILEVKDLCKTYVIDKRNGLLCRQGYCEAVTDGACEGAAG